MFEPNFWQTQTSPLLLNPRFSQEEAQSLNNAVIRYPKTQSVWLRSSGTESSTEGIKLVCIKKQALLVAAKSVNEHFKVSSQDRWLNPLPHFHVGGLAIGARCFLSGAEEVVLPRWDEELFVSILEQQSVTLASLVPTQIYDLVKNRAQAPQSLRVVLVGGGALSDELYKKAWEFGWPLYPSYGMTETSAALAITSFPCSQKDHVPFMETLPHIQLEKSKEKFCLRSQSLFEGFLWLKKDGSTLWQDCGDELILDDKLDLSKEGLRVLGRESELIKILGESVNLAALEMKLAEQLERPVAIVAKSDERRGYKLVLFVEGQPISLSVDNINKSLMPYERMDKMTVRSCLPRSPLGKVIKSQLI